MPDSSVGQSVSRECPCCEGRGCEECDGTGKRITTYLSRGTIEMRVHGTALLSEADKAALAEIGQLAYDRMKAGR